MRGILARYRCVCGFVLRGQKGGSGRLACSRAVERPSRPFAVSRMAGSAFAVCTLRVAYERLSSFFFGSRHQLMKLRISLLRKRFREHDEVTGVQPLAGRVLPRKTAH